MSCVSCSNAWRLQRSKSRSIIRSGHLASRFWSCSFLLGISFDRVAELVRTKIHRIKGIIRSLTKTTITSSSGETQKFTWNYHLKKGADVNMLGHDHRVPRVPQPIQLTVSSPHSWGGQNKSLLTWQSQAIKSSYLSFQQQPQTMSSRKTSCSRVSCQRTLRQSTESPRTRSKKQDREKTQTENKAQKIQDLNKEIKEIKEELETLKSKLEQKNQLCSRRISFSGTPCVMRHQQTQMSWSEESCERQIQIQAQSLDWRFGVKCQFILRVQRKRELRHSSSRSCHRWSGMQRSQRMSFSKKQRSMDHLVMEPESAECQLGSRPERSKRIKEWQRNINLLNLWEVRTYLKSMLVEQGARWMEFSKISSAAQRKFRFSVLKGSLQYSSIPSRSACSNVTARSTQRISRPTTSNSAATASESESSFDAMRINCDCSVKFRTSRWIQWSKTQHQVFLRVKRFRIRSFRRQLRVISVLNRTKSSQSSSGTLGSSH